MAGFFGLFGGKTKYVDSNEIQTNGQENQDAFFLNPDEAKTLGNIEFMRKSHKIRRTFPKTQGNQVTEVIKEVSSINKTSQTNASVESQASQPTEAKTENPTQSTPRRRGSDSSMDLFRNMARDLKK